MGVHCNSGNFGGGDTGRPKLDDPRIARWLAFDGADAHHRHGYDGHWDYGWLVMETPIFYLQTVQRRVPGAAPVSDLFFDGVALTFEGIALTFIAS